MAERDANGRFIKGWKGGPGRPAKEIKGTYLGILREAVTGADWLKVAQKALQQAQRGNKDARKWLADYIVGKPPQEFVIDERSRIALTWDDADNGDSAAEAASGRPEADKG